MTAPLENEEPLAAEPVTPRRLPVTAKIMAVLVLVLNLLELPSYLPVISPIPLPLWLIGLGLTAVLVTVISAALVLRRRIWGARLAWLVLVLQVTITVAQIGVYSMQSEALINTAMSQGQLATDDLDDEALAMLHTIMSTILLGMLGVIGLVRIVLHVLYAIIVNRRATRLTYTC